MTPRRSTFFLGTIAGLALALAGLFLHAFVEVRASRPALERKAAWARQLELTDLCLFTEASYTRHPSMTDSSTPFQDAPMSLEHFPSGALVGPPPHLAGTRGYGN